mmetsp:Transcript_28233/g.76514  ORF Transcript_28233/g.76514 Transcript_28233/m.76514 type:complete len:360 (+) Transcript_28233:294-1373(+)
MWRLVGTLLALAPAIRCDGSAFAFAPAFEASPHLHPCPLRSLGHGYGHAHAGGPMGGFRCSRKRWLRNESSGPLQLLPPCSAASRSRNHCDFSFDAHADYSDAAHGVTAMQMQKQVQKQMHSPTRTSTSTARKASAIDSEPTQESPNDSVVDRIRSRLPLRWRTSFNQKQMQNQMQKQKEQSHTYHWTKKNLAIALPALLGLLVDPLLSIVDTAFVGRGSNPAIDLAALGVCTSIFHMAFTLFRASTVATTALVGAPRAPTNKSRSPPSHCSLRALPARSWRCSCACWGEDFCWKPSWRFQGALPCTPRPSATCLPAAGRHRRSWPCWWARGPFAALGTEGPPWWRPASPLWSIWCWIP